MKGKVGLLTGDDVGLFVGEASVVTSPDTLRIATPEDCFKLLRNNPLSTAVLNLKRMTSVEKLLTTLKLYFIVTAASSRRWEITAVTVVTVACRPIHAEIVLESALTKRAVAA